MGFNFQTPPENRSGEFIGRGIESAGASIGAALEKIGQQHKELKGYKTLLEAYSEDPQNGINPDSIEKMTLEQAKNSIYAAEIRKSRAVATQQQTALADFFGNVDRNTQPKTDVALPPIGSFYKNLVDPSAPSMVTTAPGMDLKSAIIAAASRNPSLLSTENPASKVFGNAMAAALKAPNVGAQPQTDTSGRFFMTPQGWKPLPRTATGTTPSIAPGLKGWSIQPEPDDEVEATSAPGLFRVKRGGKNVGFYQDTTSAPRVAGAAGGYDPNSKNPFRQKGETDEEYATRIANMKADGDGGETNNEPLTIGGYKVETLP